MKYPYEIKATKEELFETMLKMDKEIEKLNKGYCPIKEKCNKGECDCTNEEYNQMCEENIKLDLEIERLNNILDKINRLFDADTYCEDIYYAIGTLLKKEYFEIEMIDNEEILNILKGVDKE